MEQLDYNLLYRWFAGLAPDDPVWDTTTFTIGHFSGGRHFEGGNGQTLIDWRDDNLCFPSRQKCQAWIAGLRRAYRRPEGLLDLFTAALNGVDAFGTCALYIRARRVWRAAMLDALKTFIAEVAGSEAPARSFGDEVIVSRR
jgi:hypothetical protein